MGVLYKSLDDPHNVLTLSDSVA